MSTRVDDLIGELSDALQGVTTPFPRNDRADRVYEGYLFAQVIAAAAECDASVAYEDAAERDVKDLVFRGAPGSLHSRTRPFTHAPLTFGQARPLEVHLRVKVRSRTFESESDVLIIDTNAARESRRKQRLPSPANCILTVEGKYYLIPLPREEALQYLGVRSNFPSTMASLFVTNSFSPKANQCLAQKAAALPYEFGVMPATRFQAYVRAHIRAALRRHVLRFDFGHRM